MCDSEMKKAYEVSINALWEKLKRDIPSDEEHLKSVSDSDVVVVRGAYDRVQDLMRLMDIPHIKINPEDVGNISLRPSQVVFINCPGELSPDGITNIRQFVESGGFLVTTDWALKHVIERAFPGIMKFNQRPTRDDVVRIELLDGAQRFLEGLIGETEDPLWWLEGSSYPIEILDRDRVEILITSREMQEKYGEAPIAVTFNHGEGSVFHIVSHYYLQRSDLRTARHKTPSSGYFAEKGLILDEEMEKVSLGSAESAYISSSYLAKLLIEKKKKDYAKSKKNPPDDGIDT